LNKSHSQVQFGAVRLRRENKLCSGYFLSRQRCRRRDSSL
jgi:hypothetical protein